MRLQEVVSDLRTRLDGVAADPGRLEVVEQRLLEIAEVERRFEAPLPELVERAAQARGALELLAEAQTGWPRSRPSRSGHWRKPRPLRQRCLRRGRRPPRRLPGRSRRS